MGKSREVPIVVEIDGQKMAWDRKGAGKPTDENLRRYIIAYGKSLEVGGVNHHLSRALGYVPYPRQARVYWQRTGETLATWSAGMFQVW